ncbi:hypothetical protein [Absidia glauca]|uniref:Xylanolytic transcriptional activator regulatory domain-containing protein n=1 Tax=Absidia glauca TaxID=4829 RepID=A0A168S7G2_ABSGL|nr:hypothetical protein [Absidia glauca]
MLNNFPPLKRHRHDADTIGNCLYCDIQQQQDGRCPHQSTTSQLASEYQQLRAETEDPTSDMEDIERRLRKLETRLTSRMPDDANHFEQQLQRQRSVNDVSHPSFTYAADSNTSATNPDLPPQVSTVALTSTGIDITTSIAEPHHFIKLLLSGINATDVQQRAEATYGRRTDMVGPAMDNPNNQQGISNLAIDKEDPEELVWLDLVLTTRYPMCFLVYQMVEKDRLVEWISHAYIDNLHGQVKLEHSLLAKSVRAFVCNHEKVSARHDSGGGPSVGDGGNPGGNPGDIPLSRNINLNRGAFYFQQAEELLELCYMNSSRNNIRSLLHMYMYQVMIPGGHIKSVQYSDLAIRMALALKLNTEKGMLVNEQLREDDRRLWWSTVWVHLWACVSFNRPLLVDPSDIMVPNSRPPSKRQDESSQAGYCIDLCVNSVKLILLSQSNRLRLAEKSTEVQLLRTLQDIEHHLDAWSLALPEFLQLRFLTNGTNTNPQSDHMDDVGQHDHSNLQSSQVSRMEIALLLHGQWATAKMRVYECFCTNDASVLDLLVVRNRLHVAVEFTNYLAQVVEMVRPCFLMYILTETQSSLTTLITLAAYKHNTGVIQQVATRQLSILKALFQRYPFSDHSTCQQWVQRIDLTLQEYASSPLPATIHAIPTGTDWSTSLLTTEIQALNESTSNPLSIYTYTTEDLQQTQHYHYGQHQPHPYSHHYQPYLHQAIINEDTSHDNLHPINFGLPPPASADEPKRTPQNSHEWIAPRRTSMLDGLELYPMQGDTNHSLSRLPHDRQTQQYLHPPTTHHYLHQHDITTQDLTLTTPPSLGYQLKPPPLPSNASSSSSMIHRQPSPLHVASNTSGISLPPPNLPPSQLPREYRRDHYQQDHHHRSDKAASKQPSWSSPDVYPDSPSLDPDHPFLSQSSTGQSNRRF